MMCIGDEARRHSFATGKSAATAQQGSGDTAPFDMCAHLYRERERSAKTFDPSPPVTQAGPDANAQADAFAAGVHAVGGTSAGETWELTRQYVACCAARRQRLAITLQPKRHGRPKPKRLQSSVLA